MVKGLCKSALKKAEAAKVTMLAAVSMLMSRKVDYAITDTAFNAFLALMVVLLLPKVTELRAQQHNCTLGRVVLYQRPRSLHQECVVFALFLQLLHAVDELVHVAFAFHISQLRTWVVVWLESWIRFLHIV